MCFRKMHDMWFKTNFEDFINVMSYDLRKKLLKLLSTCSNCDIDGEWDRDNYIGSKVYAHTNITEVDQALDLLWRNGFPPSKVNLGLAFYGRSYKLSDPRCSIPGCDFKHAGDKGKCTDTEGILSYGEVMDILSTTGGSPTYDEAAAINYFVYGGDNWISFDDTRTFQKKIDLANSRGLSGLLIWAVDLDNDDLVSTTNRS
jgi:chitinase